MNELADIVYDHIIAYCEQEDKKPDEVYREFLKNLSERISKTACVSFDILKGIPS